MKTRPFARVTPLLLALTACSSADPGTLTSSSSSSGSGTSSGSASPPSPASSAAASDDVLQHCVDVINSYRAKINATPYTRSSALEQFAATGAQSDSQTGTAHGHFIATSGGNGIAFAENEIPGWPIASYGTVTDILDQGTQMMWAEGPGGGHYDNMSSSSYTQAGCGVFVTSSSDVWVTTDFK